jgi:hypothetical protein
MAFTFSRALCRGPLAPGLLVPKGLLVVALALGCSDATGVEPSSPHSTGGAGGGGGHVPSGAGRSAGGARSGGAQSGGAPTVDNSAGRGGVVGAGSAGRGGTTNSGGAAAGTFGAGGSPLSGGGAGTSSSGGMPHDGGSGGLGLGGATTAGTAGESGQSQGGSAGGSGRAGSSGTGSGGAPGGAGGGAAGSSGSIDTTKVTTSCPGAVPSGVQSSWCSCEQWGEKASGSYTYYNDIWGSGPGPQCIWLTDAGEWGITSQHPNSSGIKSYPNISLSPQKAISGINTYTSSFDVIVPSGGSYEAAYDLWVKGTTSTRIEIMLWMTYRGGVQPIAKSYDASGAAVPDVTNVTVGGHTWNVYYGSNGANDVASFLRTSNTTSATVDVKAILLWLIANNKSSHAVFTASYTLDQVQFGYEITSDAAIQAYVTKKFAVSSD